MKLTEFSIRNFGCFGDTAQIIPIDNIVVLIGPNNSGKSTVFDAYEVLSMGTPKVTKDQFHNDNMEIPCELEALCSQIEEADTEKLGANWVFQHEKYGDCVRVKYVFERPNEVGKKYTWHPGQGDFVEGGAGGWPQLLSNRLPTALRIAPSDSTSKLEGFILKILSEAATRAIESDPDAHEKLVGELEQYAKVIEATAKEELDNTCNLISQSLGNTFPDYGTSVDVQLTSVDLDKLVVDSSEITIIHPNGQSRSLASEGTGLKRAFMWSALSVLAQSGKYKKGQTAVKAESTKMIMIEEPEAFLHPPSVRKARETLYDLAEATGIQVVVSTHSPIFIDVAKPHTTIVRVAADPVEERRVFSTEAVGFSEKDREHLQMVRTCNPMVNEFFFASKAILIEGETEEVVLKHLIAMSQYPIKDHWAVVNCLSKSNIPRFQKILNHFGVPYVVLHDSDSPKCEKPRNSGKFQGNGMWTYNQAILDEATTEGVLRPGCSLIAHIPDFEGHYFKTHLESGKPDFAISQLQRDDFATAGDLEELRNLATDLFEDQHPNKYTSRDRFLAMVNTWIEENNPDVQELWQF